MHNVPFYIIGDIYIVSILINIVIQFFMECEGTRLMDSDDNKGMGGNITMFVIFGIIIAPITAVMSIENLGRIYKPVTFRKDIDYYTLVYFLPVLTLLGLYWL